MIRWGVSICSIVILLCGCSGFGTGNVNQIAPGERPRKSSDEAGLWLEMDRVELKLRKSGWVVKDVSLNDYVRRIVCKLTSEHCSDIRIYIVRHAGFNASMAPNGVMQIWTGTLLRLENESQLAYVIGHELGHYLERHSLQRWRDIRSKTSALVFFQLASAAAGFGQLGNLAGLGLQTTIFAFSREQEQEADLLGFQISSAAGYDPKEAPKIWQGSMEERKAMDDSEPFIFFSTHPASADRMEKLKALAFEAGDGDWFVGRDEYRTMVLPMRSALIREELRLRKFARVQVLLDRLFKKDIKPGELHFFQGELFRLRAQEGDEEKAIAAYRQGITMVGAPAESYLELGLLYLRRGETVNARLAFKEYLLKRPNAKDSSMIRSYLSELGE